MKYINTLSVLLALLLILYTEPVAACMSAPHVPTATCSKEKTNASGYYRVNNLFFNIPNEYIPHGRKKRYITPQPLSLFERGAHINIHAMWDTLEPVCSYVHKREDTKNIENLYSLYHHSIGNYTSCTGYAKKGPYLDDFITQPLIITLVDKGAHHQINDLTGAYNHDVKKTIKYYERVEEVNRGVKLSTIDNVQGFDAYLLDKTELFSSRGIHNFKPSKDIISWQPVKKLFFKSKNDARIPTSIECYSKSNTKKINSPNTLNEYEMCKVSFVLGKNEMYIKAIVHGSRIGFNGQHLEVKPIIQKLKNFIEQFSIPEDDAGLVAEIEKRKEKNSQDIMAGRFGDPIRYAIIRGRIDVLDKLIERGVDLDKNQPLRALFTSPYTYTQQEGKLTILKALLENGASIAKANISYKCKKKGCLNGEEDPLICHAATNRELKAVELLLQHGAEVNFKERGSALHCAVMGNKTIDYKLLQLLLNAGADPHTKDNKGKLITAYVPDKEKHSFESWLNKNSIVLNTFAPKNAKEETLNRIRYWTDWSKWVQLNTLPEELKRDKDIQSALIRYGVGNIAPILQISGDVSDDKELVLTALKYRTGAVERILPHISQRLKSDYDVVKMALRQDRFVYYYKREGDVLTPKRVTTYEEKIRPYKIDPDVLKKAMQDIEQEFPVSLNSPEINADSLRLIVLRGCGGCKLSELKLPPVLANDKALAKRSSSGASFGNKGLLSAFSPKVLSDKPLMVSIIKKNVNALRYVSPALKSDRDILVAALAQHYYPHKGEWKAIDEIHNKELLKNKDILAALSKQIWPHSSRFKCSRREHSKRIENYTLLRNLKEPEECIPNSTYKYLDDYFYTGFIYHDDEEFFQKALQYNVHILNFASTRILNNKDIMLQAVEKDPLALGYASDNLKMDSELVMFAINKNVLAFKYADKSFHNDDHLAKKVLNVKPELYQYLSEALKQKEHFITLALSKDGRLLEHAPENVKSNEKFVELAMTKRPEAIEYAANTFQTNRALVRDAIERSRKPIFFARLPKEIREDKELKNIVLGKIKERELNAYALPERLDTCNAPLLKKEHKLYSIQVYDGSTLSPVTTDEESVVTTTIKVEIDANTPSSYLLLSSFSPVIWNISGNTNSIEHVVVTQSGTHPEFKKAFGGVIGVTKDKVRFMRNKCIPYFSKKGTIPEKRTKLAIKRAIGHTPAQIYKRYDPWKVKVNAEGVSFLKAPKINPIKYKYPDNVDESAWSSFLSYNPGGLATIKPKDVTSQYPMIAYTILPQDAGIAQLISNGSIKYEGNKYKIVKNIPIFPAGLHGAHSKKFIIAKGIQVPSGDYGHSCVTIEETGEELNKSSSCNH